MNDRAVMLLGIELSLGVPPNHLFWLYQTGRQKMTEKAFPSYFSASDWAEKNDLVIDDDWTRDQISSLEDVVAVDAATGALVVFVTLYRNGHIASNEQQPQQRFWIFSPNGRRLAMRSNLAEAFAYVGVLLPRKDPPDEAQRAASSWGGGHS